MFNQKLIEARIRNEEAQGKYRELLVEYIQEKVEQKFTARRKENAQILANEIIEHSKKMKELNKTYTKTLNMQKPIPLIAEQPKRSSSLTSDHSSNSTESFSNEIKIITDKMFTSGLLGDELDP